MSTERRSIGRSQPSLRALHRIRRMDCRRLCSTRKSFFKGRPSRAVSQRLPVRAVSAAEPEEGAVADRLVSDSEVMQLYRYPSLTPSARSTLLRKAKRKASSKIESLDAEQCYNISVSEPLTASEASTLVWVLRETYDPEGLSPASLLQQQQGGGGAAVVEVGPRMSFSTAWSANAVSICRSCGIDKVVRVERSRRFLVTASETLSHSELEAFANLVHDRMTEQVYSAPLTSFKVDAVPAPVRTVPVLSRGRAALEEINEEMGLAFDDWDLNYYTSMFEEKLKRDPTTVELFDIAQSNSEHSRHWFFGADIWIDGKKMPSRLFDLVKDTYRERNLMPMQYINPW